MRPKNRNGKVGDGVLRVTDGFPNQRMVVLPDRVINRCRNLPLVKELYLTHIGSFPLAPGHYVDRVEGVPQAILIYCLEGSGCLELGGKRFRAERSDAFLIPPGNRHLYYADPENPWSIFWIHFQGNMLAETIGWLDVSENNPVMHVPDTTLMHKLFENVYTCLNYHYSNDGLLLMSSELLRFISQMKIHLSSRSATVRNQTNRINESMEFMQDHLDLNLSLEDIARQAGQSVSSYSKMFRKITGETPIDYHIQLKMRKACEMLDQTKMRVSEISEVLGYSDPCYFSRYFKNFQGCSPLQYRKQTKS